MTLSARAPCGPLLKQRCLATPGSNLLRRFSSSVNHRRKKTCSESRFFCGGRRERMTLSARAPCGPLPEQRCLATPGSNLLRRFSSSVNHRRKKTCSESRFFCGGRRERITLSLRAPCGPLLKQRCLATLGSNLLRRFSSSANHWRKKTCSESRFFCGGRRERMTLSARAPCGPLLKQRCLATLGSNLLRRFSSSANHWRKKTCSESRFFCGGRRERIRTSDPLVPNQLRYQAALLAVICYCLLSFFMNSKKTASKKPFLKVAGERG